MISVLAVASAGFAVMEQQSGFSGVRATSFQLFLSIVCTAESLAVQVRPQGSEECYGRSSR